MNYIIGDIGNTSTRICLLNKSKILKSIIFDTKNIFLIDIVLNLLLQDIGKIDAIKLKLCGKLYLMIQLKMVC